MRQIRLLFSFMLLACSSAYGQTNKYGDWLLQQRLPDRALQAFKQHGLNGKYKFSNFINPFYLEADFNGDRRLDIAVAIEDTATKKKGFIIFHGASGEYFIFGAGASFGNGGDDFKWMDIWKVNRNQAGHDLTFDSNSERSGSQKAILKNPGIDVIKSESAAGLIYWDGSKYKWAQAGD